MIMKFVYLMRCGDSHYKIGVAQNILSRLKSLQTSNPNVIELVTAKRTSEYSRYERMIHKQLHQWKAKGGREWFKLEAEQALEIAVLINTAPEYSKNDLEIITELIDNNVDKQKSITASLSNLLNQLNAERVIKDKRLTSSTTKKTNLEPIDARRKKEELRQIQEAIKIVKEENKVSTSLLQRRLSIGYSKAARIVDTLEERGIVGPFDGTKREVFV